MRYVALLRGINVGGRTKLSMDDLRALLSSLGHTEVTTYVQSGNALFTSSRDDAAELAQEIERRIADDLGVSPRILLRTPDELAAVVERNPFPDAVARPTTLHVEFLSAPVDDERLSQIDPRPFAPDEFQAGDRVVYLRLPNGAGRTKLGNDFWERRLGLIATGRNWNTVTKLLNLASS